MVGEGEDALNFSYTLMCVMNVVVAATVVGMAGRESEIIRKTLPIALACCLVAGTVAMVWSGL
jgi:lactate permease